MSNLYLHRCKFVVTPTSLYEVSVLEDADIVVENGTITCVGKCTDRKPSGIDTIDCREYVATPTFGNAHCHTAMTVLRGYADDYELFDWLDKVWKAEKELTQDIIYHSYVLGVLEMIMSGIGAVLDMYFHPEVLMEVAYRYGVKAVTGPIIERYEDLEHVRYFVKRFGVERTVLNIHSLYAVDHDVIDRAVALARDIGLSIHIHVSETRDEVFEIKKRFGFFPIEYMYRRGWLDERFVLVHVNWMTSWEIDMVAEKRARVVLCPVSGAKLAVGGFAPLYELMQKNVVVGLGSDGASANRFSILRNMLFLLLLYRHNYWDTRIRAEHVFAIATLGSYRAMGLKGGKIEVGFPGDIVLIDLRNPWMKPVHRSRILKHIVYSMEVSDIVYTIIDGRIVWGPELRDRILRDVEESEKRIVYFVERFSST